MNLDNFNEELGKAIREQNRQKELDELHVKIGEEFTQLLADINKEREIRNGLTDN